MGTTYCELQGKSNDEWGCVMLGPVPRAILFGLCFAFFASAHGQALAQECGASHEVPQIAAVYVDNYGALQAISATAWVSGSSIFYICSVDNANQRVIAQNGPYNASDPRKYSRFEWVVFNQQLWYCQQVHNANSIPTAESAAAADPRDPRLQGCGKSSKPPGSFPWSQLIRILPAQ